MLPGGDAFAGFGATPYFSEFTNAGKLVFDASLPADDGSYRVYSFPWSTTPTTKPAVAAQRVDPSTVAVYASWNGATTVARWQVLAGADAGSLQPVAAGAADRLRDPDRRAQLRAGVRGAGAGRAGPRPRHLAGGDRRPC